MFHSFLSFSQNVSYVSFCFHLKHCKFLFILVFRKNRFQERSQNDAKENDHQYTGNRSGKEDVQTSTGDDECLTHIVLQKRRKYEGQKHRSCREVVPFNV